MDHQGLSGACLQGLVSGSGLLLDCIHQLLLCCQGTLHEALLLAHSLTGLPLQLQLWQGKPHTEQAQLVCGAVRNLNRLFSLLTASRELPLQLQLWQGNPT